MRPFGWNVGLGEDSFHRTLGNAGIAVNTRLRIDVQHIIVKMKSFNGTDESTVSVAAVHTGFSNHVCHSDGFSLKK
jgi:hypothetical protein